MDAPNTIALILARKGSKGLSGKNLATLNGHPLVARPILDMQKSGVVADIVVSTDCETIQQTATSYGACAPFLRPAEDALDCATTEQSLRFALNKAEQYFKKVYKYAIFLTPTDVYRNPLWICECYKRLVSEPLLESVFIGYPTTKNYWELNSEGKWTRIRSWMSEYGSRQTRQSIIREDTGVCCVSHAWLWREGRRIGDNVDIIVKTHPLGGLDIHTKNDLLMANFALEINDQP